jgi:hypothetical protein
MRAQAYQDRSATLVDLAMRTAESEPLSGITLKLKAAGFPDNPSIPETLTPLEQEQYFQWLRAHQQWLSRERG